MNKEEENHLTTAMDSQSKVELLTHRYGASKVGVDASDDHSPSGGVPEHGFRLVSAMMADQYRNKGQGDLSRVFSRRGVYIGVGVVERRWLGGHMGSARALG